MTSKSQQKKLTILRKQIDRQDAKILSTLQRRMEIAKKIGQLKSEMNLPVLQASRWAQVMKERLRLANKLGLPRSFVVSLFTSIHATSIQTQKKNKGAR